MKLHFHAQGPGRSIAVTIVALLGLMSGQLMAAAPPPPVTLTPEQISKMLEEGANVLKQGNPELAIKNYFEPVNQFFMRQTAKAGANDEIYSSHGATETTAYTSKIAKQNETAKTPTQLVTVDGAWTDALVLKARAQAALNHTDQAISTLDQATIISPAYPSPWLELGSVYQVKKDWEKSQSAYHNAERFAGAVEDKAMQLQMLTAALRGQAVAVTEIGRLDEAEALYKRSLKYDPNDSAATAGIAHIVELRGGPAPGTAVPGAAPATPPATTPH